MSNEAISVPDGRQTAPLVAPSQASGGKSAEQSAAFFPVLLTDTQAAACLGVGVRKFHELRAEDWMPRPIVLGPRMLRWPRAELESAVASMPRQVKPSAEPAQLLKARVQRGIRTGFVG